MDTRSGAGRGVAAFEAAASQRWLLHFLAWTACALAALWIPAAVVAADTLLFGGAHTGAGWVVPSVLALSIVLAARAIAHLFSFSPGPRRPG